MAFFLSQGHGCTPFKNLLITVMSLSTFKNSFLDLVRRLREFFIDYLFTLGIPPEIQMTLFYALFQLCERLDRFLTSDWVSDNRKGSCYFSSYFLSKNYY